MDRFGKIISGLLAPAILILFIYLTVKQAIRQSDENREREIIFLNSRQVREIPDGLEDKWKNYINNIFSSSFRRENNRIIMNVNPGQQQSITSIPTPIIYTVNCNFNMISLIIPIGRDSVEFSLYGSVASVVDRDRAPQETLPHDSPAAANLQNRICAHVKALAAQTLN